MFLPNFLPHSILHSTSVGIDLSKLLFLAGCNANGAKCNIKLDKAPIFQKLEIV
jgi:hypothetical protein